MKMYLNFMIACALFAQSTLAEDQPLRVLVRVAPDGCPQYVREIKNNDPNDPANRCEKGGVKQSDAVCKTLGSEIIWRLAGPANPTGVTDPPFTISVKDDESPSVLYPCRWNTSGPKREYTCTVNSSASRKDYSYTITINYTDATKDCMLDPRIIIY